MTRTVPKGETGKRKLPSSHLHDVLTKGSSNDVELINRTKVIFSERKGERGKKGVEIEVGPKRTEANRVPFCVVFVSINGDYFSIARFRFCQKKPAKGGTHIQKKGRIGKRNKSNDKQMNGRYKTEGEENWGNITKKRRTGKRKQNQRKTKLMEEITKDKNWVNITKRK